MPGEVGGERLCVSEGTGVCVSVEGHRAACVCVCEGTGMCGQRGSLHRPAVRVRAHGGARCVPGGWKSLSPWVVGAEPALSVCSGCRGAGLCGEEKGSVCGEGKVLRSACVQGRGAV